LLIVGIAFLSEQRYPPWWAPVLKLTFTFSYVALAPWMGHVADAFIKRDLMILMNAVKFAEAIFLLLGVHLFLCVAVVDVVHRLTRQQSTDWSLSPSCPSCWFAPMAG
jgi:LPLT family lysophospholipid transporter-like MFS transporter